MGAAVQLRDDFDGPVLRRLAKRSRDGTQARRLLALAEIYDGRRRNDAARLAGVGLQIIRDWVVRFNAEGPDGLFNHKGSGSPSRLDDAQRLEQVMGLGLLPERVETAQISIRRPLLGIHRAISPRCCE